MEMFKQRARSFLLSAFALSFSSLHAQSPQQVIQQVVDAELASLQNDHSRWVYFQETQKPKVKFKQWVATTQQGNIERILEKDGQRLPEPAQRNHIQNFLHDTKAQKKQLSSINHDYRQIVDLLKLLPVPLFGHKRMRQQPRPPYTSTPLESSSRLRWKLVFLAA